MIRDQLRQGKEVKVVELTGTSKFSGFEMEPTTIVLLTDSKLFLGASVPAETP